MTESTRVAGATAVALALVALAWSWLPFGLDHFDQGYVLGAAALLFEHPEDVVSQKTGGLWLALAPIGLLLELGGSWGTSLVRLAAIPAALAATLAGCLVVRDRAALPTLLLAGSFSHLVARSWRIDGFLSYPLLSALGFALAALLLLEAGRGRRWLLAGGAVLGANVFVRLPNLVGLGLLVLPALLAWLEGRGLASGMRRLAWASLGAVGGVACVLVAMASLGHLGLYGQALVDLLFMARAESSPYSPRFLIAKMALDVAMALAFSAELLLLAKLGDGLAAAWRSGRGRLAWSALLVVAGALLAGLVVMVEPIMARMVPFGVVLLVLVLSLLFGGGSARDRCVDLAALAVLMGVTIGAAAGIDTGAAVGALFAGPVAVVRVLGALEQRRWGLRPVGAGIVAGALLVSAVNRLPETSRDMSGWGQPARALEAVALPGVVMDPMRARILDEVLPALAEHAGDDDYVLAYPHVPLLYFLSGYRPYLGESWPSLQTPDFVVRLLERAAREREALPIVARASGNPLGWHWPGRERHRVLVKPSPPAWLSAHHRRVYWLRARALAAVGLEDLPLLQTRMFEQNRRLLGAFLDANGYEVVWRGRGLHAYELLAPPGRAAASPSRGAGPGGPEP